jgi:TolB-like protein
LFAVITIALFAQEKPQLAVIEFSTNLNTAKVKADAATVRNLVESSITETQRYTVITRDEIDKLLNEQRIAASSISSNENREKLALKKISYIVTGSVNANENVYAIAVNVLDVTSGQFYNSKRGTMSNSGLDFFKGIDDLMAVFLAGMSTVPGTDAQRTYMIGDTGPAGGIIFYDRGFTADGWRYLEAAPARAEFSAEWGSYEKDVSGTRTDIGSGKRNTQIIVERLRSLGENNRAAQVCAAMDINGYKDWFLPSKDELDLMYTNLRQKGLGSFRTTDFGATNWTHIYWSSSQGEDDRFAWYQFFSNGFQHYYVRYSTVSVRAVRAF